MKRFLAFSLLFILLGCSSAVPNSDAKKLPKKKAGIQKNLKKAPMILRSPAFSHNGNIPAKYTCDGENISPPLFWSDVPSQTKSFVLIHDDPDAVPVAGYIWDHWILYNIPALTRSIPENSSAGVEVTTSFETAKYGGPCPPNGEHKYFFKLYALDTILNLKNPRDKKDVEAAIKGHILTQTELLGKYNRKK